VATLDNLEARARELGCDVLLEKPGDRWRLAVQSSRASVRAGATWLRRYSAMTDATPRQMEEAARALLRDLERTPPTTGESTASP
jgi:hypothetical protein